MTPSIKDIERDLRSGDRESSYEIMGQMQNFKEAYTDIILDKQIFLTSEGYCYS